MKYIGVDLAWGQKRPTGLAVLDEAGQLIHLSAVTSDDEIVGVLTPHVEADCTVAIDAPLIVVNPTGNRPAEAALNRDFARFDAGAHPSNTAKREFATAPRGAVLSARLGLDIAPDSRSRRRAIEVYPHPATVALFKLGRTLKYKHKSGRNLDSLRAELLSLVRLLEGLATATTPLHLADNADWVALVRDVEQADKKANLRRAEDQVDAVVCAYVALYATLHPKLITTYGDGETGYIVTPTLPADLTPSPRPPRVVEDVAAKAVREYAALQPTMRQAAIEAVELVTAVLDDGSINYLTVTGRAKSVASFAAKLSRVVDGVATLDEETKRDPLNRLTDLIGVRVITYVHRDVAAVAALLGESLSVEDDRDMGEETANEGRFGYASRHLQLRLDDAAQAAHPAIGARQVQVQIRTVLQHAWAEFEHDIRYKGAVPAEHASDFDRRFTLAAGLLELADREFSTIRDRLQATATGHPEEEAGDDPRLSSQELAAFLAGQYAEAGWSRTEHYAWMTSLVLELGITSLAELADVVRTVDTDVIDQRMGYHLPSGAVRRLDDVLLMAEGERYVRLHGNAHRIPLLTARLARMRGEN